MPEQVHDAARIAPAHNLHEGGAQHDASVRIEGEGDGIGLEVSGSQCLFSELRKPFMLHLSGVSSPRRSPPGGLLLELDSEVSPRDVNGRSAQGHVYEHALDSRSHCSLHVGSTCGGYGDVAGACTSTLQSFLELLSAGSKGADMADTRRLISKKGGSSCLQAA